MIEIEAYTNEIHQGDARDILAELPSNSVHFVMTSPPYWGLRDYGMDAQIGLEESLNQYIDNLIEIGDELQRVLRDDGSWWLNLGDSYASSPSGHKGDNSLDGGDAHEHPRRNDSDLPFKHKCRLFIPQRVALELIDKGWILRNDALWRKTNPMPEPVQDRLSTTFESVFHFVQNEEYYYNLDEIREPYKENTIARAERGRDEGNKYEGGVPGQTENTLCSSSDEQGGLHTNGKNPGDIFELATDGFTDGHFAVYPPKLVESPLKASCPTKVCAECEKPYLQDGTGYVSQCQCDTTETKGGVALDPMCGRGTTCKVAAEHGRRYIGIELNPEYVELAEEYVPETSQSRLDDFGV